MKRKSQKKQRRRKRNQDGGDLQKSKVVMTLLKPFTTEKYPGERHFFKHNYTGPGTRLDIRLDENDQPKPGEEPVNRVDAACLKHDIAYRNQELPQRHDADKRLMFDLSRIPNPTPDEKRQIKMVIAAMAGKLLIGQGGQKFQYKQKIKRRNLL